MSKIDELKRKYIVPTMINGKLINTVTAENYNRNIVEMLDHLKPYEELAELVVSDKLLDGYYYTNEAIGLIYKIKEQK